jgi:transcriptional regulator with XRE-family HTH domain
MGLIERGQANITVEQIEKIAKALKISVEELFKGFK